MSTMRVRLSVGICIPKLEESLPMRLKASTLRGGRSALVSLLLSNRASPPDIGLLFAKVLGKLSLDLGTNELGHVLSTSDGADAVGPRAGEDDVHLLETSALGLGEEEVDGGDQRCVENSKDNVGSPGEVGECGRGNHDNSELQEVVSGCRNHGLRS